MVFDPKLGGGVAYNQPVSQPNAMEAISSLFSFGVSTLKADSDSKTKPTEGEKFESAFREFEASKGGTFAWDRKGIREFIFKNPQFEPEAVSWAQSEGIVMKPPEEVAIDSAIEWFKTPEGIVAVSKANQLPEEDRESFLMTEAGKVKQQEADIAKLERDSKQLELEGTLDSKRWDAIKPTSKTFVENTIATTLGPIFQEVMNGNSVQIDPETKAKLGLRYDTIDLRNINAVLADTRLFLSNSIRGKYLDNFGKDAIPSEAWNKDVLGVLDNMIKIGEQFDSPQEQAAFQKALIDTEMYKKLDDNGLALVTRMVEVLPPDVANRLIGTIAGFDQKFAEVLTQDGSILGSKGIVSNVQDASKGEAEELGKQSLEILDKGFIPEVFTMFKESAKRAGYEAVDEGSFRTIIGNNVDAIVKHTNSDPEARMEMSEFLVSDVQKTLQIIENNLPTEFDLVINSQGTFSLVFTGSLNNRAAAAMGKDVYIAAEMKKAQAALPEGMSVSAINSKLATLNLLGPLGKEVKEAIGILNKPEPKKKSNTSSSTGSGGDIGAKLGIDFAAMESEAGLPSGFLNKVAMIESGGNPNAANPNSSAAGLFQQIDSNAKAYGVSDKLDPVQSTEGAVRFAVENKNYLAGVLGREPTGGELYLAHQQGPGGAARLLSNPSAKAVDIVGIDAVKLNGGDANMSAGEFANIWISKYNGSRGQTTGSYSASEGTPSVAIDSQARVVPESAKGPQGGSTGLSVSALSFDSPEVQEVVSKAQTEPEAAMQLAKELLTKPLDPAIKSLIEALVKIGERA